MSSVTPTDGGYKYYQQRVSDLEDQLRDEAKRSERRHEDQMNSLEQSYRTNLAKRDKETESTVNTIRDHSSEQVLNERAQLKGELDRVKAETYDKFGRSNNEIEYHRNRADKAIQEMADTYQRDAEKTRLANLAAEATRARAAEDRTMETVRTQQRAHEAETHQLHQQLSDVADHSKTYDKEKGQALVDVRKDFESEHRTREQLLRDQDEAQINNLKRAMENTEAYHTRLATQQERERNAQHAGMIQRLNQDQATRERDLQSGYQRSFNQQQDLMKQQQLQNEKALESQFKVQTDARTVALESQAKTNQDTLKRQKLEDQEQIQSLMNKIREQQKHEAGTLSDPSLEQQVQRQLTEKYEKLLNEEVERNTRRTDSLQQNFAQNLGATQREGKTLLTEAQQRHAAEAHRERATFLTHAQETEQNRLLSLRNQESDMNRQSEAVKRNLTTQLDRQRRDYEDLLQQTRMDASAKLTALRQEADFNMKMAQRAFTTQQNDTIREYEKKMAEQKVGYEDAIESLRYQLNHQQHEADRRIQQLLADQTKAHEQKIAQLEFQSKERERTITQNYEDQLEKIKRANALTIQKKG